MKAFLIGVLVVSILVAGPACGQEPGKVHAQHEPPKPDAPEKKPDTPNTAQPTRIGDPYPLATCPISGEKLGSMGEPIIKLYEGREVRFCCKSCPPKFEKDLPKSFATLDESIIKAQTLIYPLTTSVVTAKELPAKPVDFVYGNRLVRVGMDAERSEFLKDPAKYLKELDKAVVAVQGKDYALKACPVSKEELGAMGDAVDVVVAGRLVRLCCTSCKKDLFKDPTKYIAAVDAEKQGEKRAEGDEPRQGKNDRGK